MLRSLFTLALWTLSLFFMLGSVVVINATSKGQNLFSSETNGPLPSVGQGQIESTDIEFVETTTSPNGHVLCTETTYKSGRVVIDCLGLNGAKPELSFTVR